MFARKIHFGLILFCYSSVLGQLDQADRSTLATRETFFGLTASQLAQLHKNHSSHLEKLDKAARTYQAIKLRAALEDYMHYQSKEENAYLTQPPNLGVDNFTSTNQSNAASISWPSVQVNITCPEINWTFQYKRPFLHMSLPKCGDVIQPKMFLYHNTTSCQLQPFYLPNNMTDNCTSTVFANTKIKQIIVITHGFLKTISSSWMHDMAAGLMNRDPSIAILLVGWGRGSGGSPFPDPFYYYQAAANTRYMGVAVAKMVIELVQHIDILTNSLSGDTSLHCIGHSLGAHICGFVGKHLQQYSHLKLRRISGLDPAGPLFATDVPFPFNFIQISASARLNEHDAAFVDVIHTDGRARFSFQVIPQYGTMTRLGHIDFYPGNHGEFGWNQPGCWQVQDIDSCSHSRAHDLYLSSLNLSCPSFQACSNTTVIPVGCNNITTSNPAMGYFVDRVKLTDLHRAYTVLTIAKEPYCQNTTTTNTDHAQIEDTVGPYDDSSITEDLANYLNL